MFYVTWKSKNCVLMLVLMAGMVTAEMPKFKSDKKGKKVKGSKKGGSDFCPKELKTVLTLTGSNLLFHFEQNAPVFSPGTVILYENATITTESLSIVGKSAGVCHVLPSELFCNANFDFDGDLGKGSLAYQGNFYGNMVIVGGSGCYEGATGSAVSIPTTVPDTYIYSLDVNL
mmetsp:Transcript_30666/g.45393  ORF Transcript_30666/g.45393 Transcript_30666/m.45393 type:complete len:173 (+) Transcript_30666:125-643(+)|eukprot:CAMPEP_0195518184 /NCGR_PEP_ID=MMETSP0794_2-20130614/12505_1 /TAXON_ID=515487 /ORGANISM="Stephanopyxis turris, Strain CCMP 815" /LENGTH=172 /DNA_ID=CAMNT_0040647109 /DNA_START=125 /DNA_END=643 /DNA_ORIENTATION=-